MVHLCDMLCLKRCKSDKNFPLYLFFVFRVVFPPFFSCYSALLYQFKKLKKNHHNFQFLNETVETPRMPRGMKLTHPVDISTTTYTFLLFLANFSYEYKSCWQIITHKAILLRANHVISRFLFSILLGVFQTGRCDPQEVPEALGSQNYLRNQETNRANKHTHCWM